MQERAVKKLTFRQNFSIIGLYKKKEDLMNLGLEVAKLTQNVEAQRMQSYEKHIEEIESNHRLLEGATKVKGLLSQGIRSFAKEDHALLDHLHKHGGKALVESKKYSFNDKEASTLEQRLSDFAQRQIEACGRQTNWAVQIMKDCKTFIDSGFQLLKTHNDLIEFILASTRK